MCNPTWLVVKTGEDIKRFREKLGKGWTQKKFGDTLSVPERTLQSWEAQPDKELPKKQIVQVNQALRKLALNNCRPALLALPWDQRFEKVKTLALDKPVVALNGMPGVGKTYLVQRLLEEESIQNKFSKRILLPVGTKTDEMAVLHGVLSKLQGEATIRCNSSNDYKRSLENYLKTLERPALVVLDDVWELKQAVLVKQAMATSTSGLIVTTRDCAVGWNLVGGQSECSVCVEIMSEEDSLQLLRDRITVDDRPTDPELTKLANALEHLPLSLVVAVSMLNSSTCSLKDLCDRADEAKRLRLAQTMMEESTPSDQARTLWNESPTVLAVLDLSYEKLSEGVKKAYCACCPFAVNSTAIFNDTLSRIWKVKNPQSLINELVSRSLLEAYEVSGRERRYRIHDLILMHMEYRTRFME